jgi:hypothetical protein
MISLVIKRSLLPKEDKRMKSKEILEIISYDLANCEPTALLIRNSINSLERALVVLHNEEILETIREWA